MKAGIVGIALEEFVKVAKEIEGLTIVPQKGFVKITGNVPGRAVYPQNNKTVGEVHCSGFSQEPKTKIKGLIPNPRYPKPTKRVTHFLDQREGMTKEQILENFRNTLTSMVSAEQTEKEPVSFLHSVPQGGAEQAAATADKPTE